MTVLFEIWTVTVAYEWHKKFGNEHDGAIYTFASLKGCTEWINEQIALGEKDEEHRVIWYAIEGKQHIPCDDKKPYGQTYQAMIYHSFVQF